jgi:NADH dehydrogenase
MIEPGQELVTVFGGGGFIGRYVCEMLLKSGVRLRLASRDPRCAHFIQPLGQVGQVGYVSADITEREGVARALHGATRVVNLCGVMKGKVRPTHVEGARAVAELARENGASALVHVSAIGSDPQSESVYGSSKGEGELAVTQAFPQATIIRPSLVFGAEDQITNRFASMAKLPFLPVIAATRKFQPVYVRDLARRSPRQRWSPKAMAVRSSRSEGRR